MFVDVVIAVAVTIGSNISSLRTIRQLDGTTRNLASTSERLASGQRINRASDDAAGLAIAASLKSDTRIYTQAVRNLNDGISLLNVAEAAVGELSNVVIRLQELAEQAASGTYGYQQRAASNAEAQALRLEYERIIASTSFNNIKTLDGNSSQIALMGGVGQSAILFVPTSGEIQHTEGTGSFAAAISYGGARNPHENLWAADFNSDGKVDIIGSAYGTIDLWLGNGDGTFLASQDAPNGGFNTPNSLLADFNGDEKVDLLNFYGGGGLNIYTELGRGDGSFYSYVDHGPSLIGPQGAAIADVNGDGFDDIVLNRYNEDRIVVLRSLGDGSFADPQTIAVSNLEYGLQIGDFNGDEKIDIAVGLTGNDGILLGNGDGSFRAALTGLAGVAGSALSMVGDINLDGRLDLVSALGSSAVIHIGNGDGTFRQSVSYSIIPSGAAYAGLMDMNNDGALDIVAQSGVPAEGIAVIFGNGDGTYNAPRSFAAVASGFRSLAAADLNGDDVLDVFGLENASLALTVSLALTQGDSSLKQFTLNTRQQALQALEEFRKQLNRLSSGRGSLGASQSRISVAVANLQQNVTQYSAAESRISDADIAQESAALVRHQILQQTASGILAQANQQPRIALQLLGSI